VSTRKRTHKTVKSHRQDSCDRTDDDDRARTVEIKQDEPTQILQEEIFINCRLYFLHLGTLGARKTEMFYYEDHEVPPQAAERY